MAFAEPTGALAGVRVLEFSQVVAGPFCGLVLADMGAEVIKVEPLSGDPYRGMNAVVPMHGKRFQSLNRGKQSVAIELHSERGQDLIHRLVRSADVVVINYREGVSARLGIDYPTLSALNPGLIYFRITGFGVHGPHADRAATDPMMQAYAGLMVGGAKTTEDGLPAALAASSFADYTTGLGGVAAICAALYRRKETGLGQLIDGSLLRSSMALQDTVVMREPVSDAVGREPIVTAIREVRERGGTYQELLAARVEGRMTRSASRFYSGPYQAKDGAIMLGALTPKSQASARKVLGVAEDSAESEDEVQRIRGEIAETVRQRSVAEWMVAFESGGVPAAPVNIPEEMADDPLVAAERIMQDLVHEVTGPQRVVGPLFEMSATPTRSRSAAPVLGRHTADVLRALGVEGEEILALVRDGVVGAAGIGAPAT